MTQTYWISIDVERKTDPQRSYYGAVATLRDFATGAPIRTASDNASSKALAIGRAARRVVESDAAARRNGED